MTQPDDIERLLAAEGAQLPAPRRTDAAFARSVRDGVRARRHRAFFALPALAAAAAAVVFVVARPDVDADLGGSTHVPAPVTTPAAAAPVVDLGEDDGLFALPDFDGSSDEELARLDALLDEKIAAARQHE